MLHIVKELTDEFVAYLKDDPVRPEIPAEQRINENSRIYVLLDEEKKPLAVTCVKFLSQVPENVEQLANFTVDTSTAVFYTIWSYAGGAGRELIVNAQASIKQEFPNINTYVTLSPKTEMARRFHYKNGAKTYRENADTINYIYSSDSE